MNNNNNNNENNNNNVYINIIEQDKLEDFCIVATNWPNHPGDGPSTESRRYQ